MQVKQNSSRLKASFASYLGTNLQNLSFSRTFGSEAVTITKGAIYSLYSTPSFDDLYIVTEANRPYFVHWLMHISWHTGKPKLLRRAKVHSRTVWQDQYIGLTAYELIIKKVKGLSHQVKHMGRILHHALTVFAWLITEFGTRHPQNRWAKQALLKLCGWTEYEVTWPLKHTWETDTSVESGPFGNTMVSTLSLSHPHVLLRHKSIKLTNCRLCGNVWRIICYFKCKL